MAIPWSHTMASMRRAGADMDSSRTPNLSDAALTRCPEALANDPITQLVDGSGRTLLTSVIRARMANGGANGDGIVPISLTPARGRDFVFNANDSYWLSNPASPRSPVTRSCSARSALRRPRVRA